MVDANTFKIPPGLRVEWREVKDHYNDSGMIVFKELLAVRLINSRGEGYDFSWINTEVI